VQEHEKNPLALAYHNFKEAIETEKIELGDTEKLYHLVKPLESALAEVSEVPEGESAADKIARLLWFRSHLDRFDFPFVLQSVQDREPLVRAVAVNSLRNIILTTPNEQADQRLVFQAQRILQEQTRAETLPVLSHIQDETVREMQQLLSRTSRRLVTPPQNPYIAGLPVRKQDLFFGRGELLRQISDSFKNAGIRGVVLHGGRRTGKTSLLLHIHRGALGDGFSPVFIDVQSAAGKTALAPVILRALASNWPYIVDPLGHPQENDTADFDLLRKAVRKIIEQLDSKRLLLMFDEYEVLDTFFPDNASVARMQSLLENEPSLLTVYAGPQALQEVRNRYLLALLDTCKYMPISFLDPEDTARLIRVPAEGMLQFSDSAVSRIQQLCGGHPFYVQLVCQSVFTLKGGLGAVSDEDVETVVKQLIASPPPHLVLTWQGLDENSKLVAAALASAVKPGRSGSAQDVIKTLHEQQYPAVPRVAIVEQAFAALRRADLLRKAVEASPSYVFTMEFVRRWIADSRTVWDILEERRADALSRAAPTWRRLSASAGDFVIEALIILLISFSVYDVYRIGLIVLPLYFIVFLTVSDRTVAMRMLRLRLVNEDGTQPQFWRSSFYALLLTLGVASFFLVVYAMVEGAPWSWIGMPLLLCEVLHQLRIAIHHSRRGIYDSLTRTVVIYEPTADRGKRWKA